jgi:LPXTG-motif cell wall-anchored protein
MRLIIFFGVLLPLKYALPYTGLSAAAQVIALVGVATMLVGAFWFACSEGRRGGLLLVAVLWIAAIAKIAMQP